MSSTERKFLNGFTEALNANLTHGLELDANDDRAYNILETTKSAFYDSASVPEREFCISLVDLFINKKVRVVPGWMTEEDYRELIDGSSLTEADVGLEMFVNPSNLFLDGKIRPDVVFRKGRGNYIIFEVDSFQYHSSQEALRRDKVRERKIQSLGYPVFRYSAKEMLDGHSWVAAIEAYKTLEARGFIPSHG